MRLDREGFILLCGPPGDIRWVLFEGLPGLSALFPGMRVRDLAPTGFHEKIDVFFTEVQEKGAAFLWDSNLTLETGIEALRLLGTVRGENILVVGAKTVETLFALYDDLAVMERGQEPARLLSLRDVSERRKAEEKPALEELRAAKAAADAANQAKSEFLANMSHELRTPLNAVIGFTELVVDEKFGPVNSIQKEFLNDALQSGRHLLSLINDILDLSKVEAGKLEFKPSDVDVERLVCDSPTMVRESAVKSEIEIRTCIGSIPKTIRADARALQQVLFNLLSNAVKFTPCGGSIDVAVNEVYMCLLNAEKNATGSAGDGRKIYAEGFVEFSVTDTGLGIEPGDIRRIFEPFEQANRPVDPTVKGTGLGLSLSRKLVELHGGRLWAESDGKLRGSSFRFIIPFTA